MIDDILKGMDAQFKAMGGEKIVQNIQNPEADAATQQTIAQQFANGGCDVKRAFGDLIVPRIRYVEQGCSFS